MGYRMIADHAGLPLIATDEAHIQIADARWQGYLCNIAPAEFEMHYRDHLPETIAGREFLARYGGSTDRVTTIAPERRYSVRRPTAHPIYEHHRVRLFRALLASPPPDEERLRLLGELMYQSHNSYSACGLGSAGTDRLVGLVREAGPAAGLYGAKITGGGSGGTVAVLGRRAARPAVEALARRYQAEIGQEVLVLSGSSPGAIQFGVVRVRYAPGA
jgi:L-arabinokinase